MRERIQPYEIQGVGIATEALVEIQSQFTTEDKAVIYYDLRDKTQTSTVRIYSTGEVFTLPYKIIFYQKIIVTGNDRNAVIVDAKQAVEIFKRERGDVTVLNGINLSISKNSGEVCVMYSNGDVIAYYLDTEDLSTASVISETEDMQSVLKAAGYVSDGEYIRYWTGDFFDEGFLKLCKG